MFILYIICIDENIYVWNRGCGMEVVMFMYIWVVIIYLLKKKEKKWKVGWRVLLFLLFNREKNEFIW